MRRRLGTSAVLSLCLDELAFKYPGTKFVKIVSTECIPSYPDQNLPTVLVYHRTQCVRTLAGLGAFGGLRTTPESAPQNTGPVIFGLRFSRALHCRCGGCIERCWTSLRCSPRPGASCSCSAHPR